MGQACGGRVATVGLAAVAIAAVYASRRGADEQAEAGTAGYIEATAPAIDARSPLPAVRSKAGPPVEALPGGTSALLTGQAGAPAMAEAAVRSTGPLQAGILDFRWAGSDCWRVYRGEQPAGSGCGAAKLTLQTGRYLIKSSSALFVPFEVEIRPNQTLVAGNDAGHLEFTWPGNDCWQLFRGEVRVAAHCGAGKQVLQAGRYTLKASSAAVFQPVQVDVKANQLTRVDVAAGTFDFNWPGSDCWTIHRGEERVASGCGPARQALQQGRYVVKTSSNAFEPFEIRIVRDKQLRAP